MWNGEKMSYNCFSSALLQTVFLAIFPTGLGLVFVFVRVECRKKDVLNYGSLVRK